MGFRGSVVLVLSVCGLTNGYAGGLDFPFSRTSDWEVCRGYNTPGTTHSGDGRYALDIAIGTGHTSGASGCSKLANQTTNEEILAPASGVIKRFLGGFPDISCLKLDQPTSNGSNLIRSISIGHLQSSSERVAVGNIVAKGEKIGIACAPGACTSDRGYAHAHLKAHTDDNCTKSAFIPFGSAFDGFNFTNDGSVYQWRKTVISERIQEDILKLAFVRTNSPATYSQLKVNLAIGNNTSSRVTVDDIAISFYPLNAPDLTATPIGKCYRTKKDERGNIKTLEPKGSPGASSFLLQNLKCNLPDDNPRSGKYKLVFKAKRNGVFQVFASSSIEITNKLYSERKFLSKTSNPLPITKVVDIEDLNILPVISLLLEDEKKAPINLELIGSIDLEGYSQRIDIHDNLAFIAAAFGGLIIVDISSPSSPSLVSSFVTPGITRDVVVRGDYAYLADFTSGLQILDISNPATPVIVGSAKTPGDAFGVDVSGDYAFVAARDTGVQIIDISNPNAPRIVSSIATQGSASNIVISNDFAYIVDFFNGVQIANVTDPLNPSTLSLFAIDGLLNNIVVKGDNVYLANGPVGGLRIIDTQDKVAPFLVSNLNVPTGPQCLFVDGNYVYLTDGHNPVNSLLSVVDISELEKPSLELSIKVQSDSTCLAIQNGHLYLLSGPNGTGIHGLQVFKINNL